MKKHIVIIEDDSNLREVLKLTLEDCGYCVTAIDGLSSVEELVAYQADCYVIDEYLPGTTGHIICILLKAKPETRHIPVLLISASDQLTNQASLCEAEAFLHKPFKDIDDVCKIVNSLIRNDFKERTAS